MKRTGLLFFVIALVAASDPLISRIGDSATELKKGDFAKALKIDNRLIGDMLEELGPGDAESKWFAVAVAHKALALAGLGRDEEAIWYWHVALNIYPAVANADMSMFGAQAEFLKRHPLAEWDVPRIRLDSNIQPPRVRKRVEPHYATGARAFGVSGLAIFECVIGEDGMLHDIRILRALPAPTLSYAAMEALRQWTFEPATLDGKPVAVKFNLTINYKLR